jgi:hypothetical protein
MKMSSFHDRHAGTPQPEDPYKKSRETDTGTKSLHPAVGTPAVGTPKVPKDRTHEPKDKP